MFSDFGYVFGNEKCSSPQLSGVLLGFLLTTVDMSITMGPARHRKILRAATKAASQAWCTIEELASLVGRITSCREACPEVLYFVQRWLPVFQQVPYKSWSKHRPWTPDDTTAVTTFLDWVHEHKIYPRQQSQSECTLDTSTAECTLQSDASSYGAGAVLWLGIARCLSGVLGAPALHQMATNVFPRSAHHIGEKEASLSFGAYSSLFHT